MAQLIRLLVIDDNADQRMLVPLFMGPAGFEVTVADGGAEGLEILKRERFDAVLLDLYMEGLGGYQVLERVGAETLATTPFILHTAAPNAELGAATGLIKKPCGIHEMPVLVKGFIDKFKGDS